ncbi:MAG: HAD family phosphatase [Methylococcales bacterium]|jgi:HAD superfamily hydrolase (TIGR01509 family)|nr:HAD family phosphatase [Methylococcales bacterium]
MIKGADFSAVILDLDGLILDTEKTYRIAWQSALELMGYSFPIDLYQGLCGLQYESIEQFFGEQCGANFNVRIFRKISAEQWHDYVGLEGIAVKAGAFDLLTALTERQIPYCLATNSLSENAERNLEIAGIGYLFPNKVTRDQVKQGKPAPDIFLLAAKLMGYPIAKCLAVEDSVVGVEAAQVAGAIPIWVPDSYSKQTLMDSEKVCQLNDLVELERLLF